MSTETVLAPLNSNPVHLGTWTNWSRGATAGLTLTLTQRSGGFLIAFLALYVTLTGTCFWTIVAFITHQVLGRTEAQDGVYHQRQAILRNSDTGAAGMWRLARMLWAWRGRAEKGAVRRSIVPLLLSFATLGVFAVAGIFSSNVATSRAGEVLIDGSNCGLYTSLHANASTRGLFEAYLLQRVQASSNYALMCYLENSFASNCRTFSRPSLPYSVSRGVPCPFPGKEKICREVSGGIRLDSGYLDSHRDLGINAPPAERFLYRSVKECAPVLNEGYTIVNTSNVPPTFDLYYGSWADVAPGLTYQYLNETHRLVTKASSYRNTDYVLGATTYYAPATFNGQLFQNSYKPILELSEPKDDLVLLHLSSNDIVFLGAVNDPWYSAQQMRLQNLTYRGTTFDGYIRDDSVRTVACVERYQFCNAASASLASNETCTPLIGIMQAYEAATSLFPAGPSRNRFLWSSSAIMYMASGITEIISGLKSGALQARSKLILGRQIGIAHNQWELELEHWFRMTLADVQRAVLEMATGPLDPRAAIFVVPPETEEGRKLCRGQKIRSDGYTSFNVLGLILILVIGALIMVISLVLPWATRQCFRRGHTHGSLEWVANDTLQLQRLAHEALGAGTWLRACDDYPVTQKGDLLAVLDISSIKHPVLKVSDEEVKGGVTVLVQSTTGSTFVESPAAVHEELTVEDHGSPEA